MVVVGGASTGLSRVLSVEGCGFSIVVKRIIIKKYLVREKQSNDQSGLDSEKKQK